MNDPASSTSIGDVLLKVVLAQLEQAAQHLAAVGDARHTGIHQGRKCLRRARAVLELVGRKLGSGAEAVSAQIGRLGRGLSPLRDGHALLETLQRLARSEPEVGAIAERVLASARRRRDQLLASALHRDPELCSRQRRIRGFCKRLHALPWARVTEKTVSKGLGRSVGRIEKALQRAERDTGNADAWHRLRRRVRRLRQQQSVVEEIAPKLHADGPGHERHADLLGESQDDALLLARARRPGLFEPADCRVLRAVALRRLDRVRRKLKD